jgi:hypothetical protein
MKPIAKVFGADVFFDDGVHRVFDQHQTLGYGARYGVTELGHGTVLETENLGEAMKFARDRAGQSGEKPTSQIESEIREILTSEASDPVERRPAAIKPMRISAIDPATMTAGAINKELDKIGERNSELTDMMIEAGRGHERPSDYHRKDDPLSTEKRRIFNRSRDLLVEISMRYGPGAPNRLPTGDRHRGFFGPRKKKGE